MSEHTKEPWSVIAPSAKHECARIFAGTRYLGSIGNSDETEAQTVANARRIVACVNACEGIPTSQLERATPYDTALFFKAQRDELLAALKEVKNAPRDMLDMMNREGIVFDGTGGKWEKLALTLYSQIVATAKIAKDAIASAAIARAENKGGL